MNDDQMPAAQLALKKYRKGMRSLGVGLFVLASLQTIAGCLFLPPEFSIPVVVMGAVLVALGIFALHEHVWTNYIVAILATLALVRFYTIQGQLFPANVVVTAGIVVVVVFEVGMLCQCVINVQAHHLARSLENEDEQNNPV
jgi:hypothetical protein